MPTFPVKGNPDKNLLEEFFKPSPVKTFPTPVKDGTTIGKKQPKKVIQ